MGLDGWYCYPFGTQDNLITWQFRPLSPGKEHHVFFHFEQEPLWQNDLGLYEMHPGAWRTKVIRILANSEMSDLKKQICRERGVLDWYFFYHGFAALDWFRDSQFIQDGMVEFDNTYLSLNHLVYHKRSYRMSLLARLVKQDLIRKGSISFHGDHEDCHREIQDPDSSVSEHSKHLIDQYLNHIDFLPLTLDSVEIDGRWSARFGINEYRLWQRSFLHLVNETVFYEPKQHLTEKTFKPIVAQRPFILVAAPGNLAYLRSYGFKTFGHWIDESYDMIQDHDQRLDAIAQEVHRLSSMAMWQLKAMHQEMLPVLAYNRKHFFGRFREIIVDELVENFYQCIRIWNNCRIDGRQLVIPSNTNRVKQILLGKMCH